MGLGLCLVIFLARVLLLRVVSRRGRARVRGNVQHGGAHHHSLVRAHRGELRPSRIETLLSVLQHSQQLRHRPRVVDLLLAAQHRAGRRAAT